MNDSSFFVYLLFNFPKLSTGYIGATVDLQQRLRRHNKEITGGAQQTSREVVRGQTWIRAAHVTGFPSWKSALQFEWRWKQIARKHFKHLTLIPKYMHALNRLLSLERSTSNAIAYLEWPSPPIVVLEEEDLILPHLPQELKNTM